MMKNFVFIILLIAISSEFNYAQFNSLSLPDLNQINVDNLTDVQVSSLLKNIKKSGLSVGQVFLIAKQRGVSDLQIQKLKKRIATLKAFEKNELDDEGISAGNIRDMGKTINYSSNIRLTAPIDSILEKIFGSKIFRNVNLNFEPNINAPTPMNYQIGAGDEVIIDIWGASEKSYRLSVSPEGMINIANLGPVNINGLTVEKAAQKIKKRMSKIYAGLNNQNQDSPATNFQFSLGNLKSVKINVIGEVLYPGSYMLTSFSTMFNAIYYAGGPNKNGSMRKVDLIRNNEKISSLDLYQYLINGKLTSDIKLQDQDVIIMQPYINRVTLNGEVKRPAIYETIEEETFADLLVYAGGFNEVAYKSSVLIKRNNDKKKEIITLNRIDFSTFKLKNGDVINVAKILDKFTNRVQITGAVNRPGEYELKENLTLKNLIEQADGLKEDAFTGRGLLIRQNDDLTFSNISFHVGDILKGILEDILLKKEDEVMIKSIFDLEIKKTLSIRGSVLKEGDFPFISGMTVEDLIILSGGLSPSASKSIVEVSQRIPNSDEITLKTINSFLFPISSDLTISKEASSHVLTPWDLVIIRKSPSFSELKIVEIEGQVKYPGKYVLQSRDEKISDLIKRAGGITQFAYPKGGQLIRRTRFFEEKTETKIKNESLTKLVELDTLINKSAVISNKQFETIGIDLVAILKKPNSTGDLILQEGDVISIPKQLQIVRVSGEILNPIVVSYYSKYNLKDYLFYAGGPNHDAKVSKAFVIYPNGIAKRTKNFLFFTHYPKIEPGAEIIIPKKSVKKILSLQAGLAIISTLTSLLLVLTSTGIL